MEEAVYDIIIRIIQALGTLAVAILAIWGDRIRSAVAGPKISIRLRNEKGNLTLRANQKRTIFYHLELHNHRVWSPVRNVRLLLTSIEKKRPDGTYFPEQVVAPLQLTWSFPQFHEISPTVSKLDICDLGFLDEDADRFSPSLYVYPNNFRGYVGKGESMRIGIIATADNYHSQSPLVFEISWDGKWDDDMEEMRRHLVIRQTSSSSG
jgi:hypothetical protein